jgi:hypothetical protein
LTDIGFSLTFEGEFFLANLLNQVGSKPNTKNLKHRVIVFVALFGMVFAAFAPLLSGTIGWNDAEFSWAEFGDAEEESEESESRNSEESAAKKAEEEAKHFYDFGSSEFCQIQAQTSFIMGFQQGRRTHQHHPSIVIPPPEFC